MDGGRIAPQVTQRPERAHEQAIEPIEHRGRLLYGFGILNPWSAPVAALESFRLLLLELERGLDVQPRQPGDLCCVCLRQRVNQRVFDPASRLPLVAERLAQRQEAGALPRPVAV